MALPVPKREQGMSLSHARSKTQEKGIADKLGARITPGSGNGRFEKLDVRRKRFVRVECKNTVHDSFSIDVRHIFNLEKAGATTEEIPFMVVDLGVHEKGKKASFCVLPASFLELVAERLKVDVPTP